MTATVLVTQVQKQKEARHPVNQRTVKTIVVYQVIVNATEVNDGIMEVLKVSQ